MNNAPEKYVFVSYSRKDQDRVMPIVERLRQAGASVWIDQEGIDGASFWAEEIVNAIRKCTLFLFMVSENAVDSSNTNRELALAAERNLPILPVYLARAELPARTAYQLAGIHYIEMLEGPTDRSIKAVLQAFQRAGIELLASPLRTSPLGDKEPVHPAPLAPRAAGILASKGADSKPHVAANGRSCLTDASESDFPHEATCDLAAIVDHPVLFRETPMSRLLLGHRHGVGKVVLKVLSQVPPETLEWLHSNMYRQVMGERLIDQGTLPTGELWVLMRHIDALPLSELVRSDNVIVGALLDDIVLSLMEKLSVLHGADRPVIHRDVTPGNVMITFAEPSSAAGSPESMTVHLLDYEAACFADSSQTPVGAGGFAPPEQIQGKAVPASDLYSLLATAYFLATGKLPPNLARAGTSPIKFPDVWGSWTRLDDEYGHDDLKTCWALAPGDRPLSAREFLDNVVVPRTRCMFDAKAPLGSFSYCENLQVLLWDRSYSVQKRP